MTNRKQARFRRRSAAGIFLACLTLFCVLLWNLQVVEGAQYYEKSQHSIAKVETVPAARGRLLDRNGAVLADNQVTWQATLTEEPEEDTRRTLQRLCREEEADWDGGEVIYGVSSRWIAKVRELDLPGVTVAAQVYRQGSGTLAPHVLGRVGQMSPEEWTKYETQGYAMDELVGKDGAEQAFENWLRGTPGEKVTQTDRSGTAVEETYTVTPRPGRDVTLTLDKALQTTAEEALGNFLATSPQSTGGAAVVLDVPDGGVLAMASFPGYDPATFSQDYQTLKDDPARPLYNRAIQGLYAPGSTFKLVTAAGALEEGIITPETRILDTGRYTYYKTPQPQCWLYRQYHRTHGLENVTEAITDSCNIFFYDTGRRLGIDALNHWAGLLGLGEKTGIELSGEEAGVVAGPAYTASVGGTWQVGSVLSAAIGQENNRFTPLQLAQMTAALVTGNRWQIHLLQGVAGESPYEKTLLGIAPMSEENRRAVKEGMLAVTQSGSVAGYFRNLPVEVGAKTGSAQVEGSEISNAVFVCFAPYDNPQVAVALVAEKGGSGSELGGVAAQILSVYFSGESTAQDSSALPGASRNTTGD